MKIWKSDSLTISSKCAISRFPGSTKSYLLLDNVPNKDLQYFSPPCRGSHFPYASTSTLPRIKSCECRSYSEQTSAIFVFLSCTMSDDPKKFKWNIRQGINLKKQLLTTNLLCVVYNGPGGKKSANNDTSAYC